MKLVGLGNMRKRVCVCKEGGLLVCELRAHQFLISVRTLQLGSLQGDKRRSNRMVEAFYRL